LSKDIDAALSALRSGGIIAYPTEAVYGLGCDPANESALQRILDVKTREAHKGFIVIASNQEQLAPYIGEIKPEWQSQLDEHWPGPVTFILPAAGTASQLLTGQRDTLAVRVSSHPLVVKLCQAVRVSSHPLVVQLCEAYGGAIVSTSANRSGHPPLQTGSEVASVFHNSIDAIIDANVGTLASPTRIIDIQTGKRLR